MLGADSTLPEEQRKKGKPQIEFITDVSVELSRTETCTDNSYTYTVFILSLFANTVSGNKSKILAWDVRRRYNDFVALNTKIYEEKVGTTDAVRLPSLPGKKLFGSSTDPEFVRKRGAELRYYLQQLVQEPCLASLPTVLKFLGHPGTPVSSPGNHTFLSHEPPAEVWKYLHFKLAVSPRRSPSPHTTPCVGPNAAFTLAEECSPSPSMASSASPILPPVALLPPSVLSPQGQLATADMAPGAAFTHRDAGSAHSELTLRGGSSLHGAAPSTLGVCAPVQHASLEHVASLIDLNTIHLSAATQPAAAPLTHMLSDPARALLTGAGMGTLHSTYGDPSAASGISPERRRHSANAHLHANAHTHSIGNARRPDGDTLDHTLLPPPLLSAPLMLAPADAAQVASYVSLLSALTSRYQQQNMQLLATLQAASDPRRAQPLSYTHALPSSPYAAHMRTSTGPEAASNAMVSTSSFASAEDHGLRILPPVQPSLLPRKDIHAYSAYEHSTLSTTAETPATTSSAAMSVPRGATGDASAVPQLPPHAPSDPDNTTPFTTPVYTAQSPADADAALVSTLPRIDSSTSRSSREYARANASTRSTAGDRHLAVDKAPSAARTRTAAAIGGGSQAGMVSDAASAASRHTSPVIPRDELPNASSAAADDTQSTLEGSAAPLAYTSSSAAPPMGAWATRSSRVFTARTCPSPIPSPGDASQPPCEADDAQGLEVEGVAQEGFDGATTVPSTGTASANPRADGLMHSSSGPLLTAGTLPLAPSQFLPHSRSHLSHSSSFVTSPSGHLGLAPMSTSSNTSPAPRGTSHAMPNGEASPFPVFMSNAPQLATPPASSPLPTEHAHAYTHTHFLSHTHAHTHTHSHTHSYTHSHALMTLPHTLTSDPLVLSLLSSLYATQEAVSTAISAFKTQQHHATASSHSQFSAGVAHHAPYEYRHPHAHSNPHVPVQLHNQLSYGSANGYQPSASYQHSQSYAHPAHMRSASSASTASAPSYAHDVTDIASMPVSTRKNKPRQSSVQPVPLSWAPHTHTHAHAHTHMHANTHGSSAPTPTAAPVVSLGLPNALLSSQRVPSSLIAQITRSRHSERSLRLAKQEQLLQKASFGADGGLHVFMAQEDAFDDDSVTSVDTQTVTQTPRTDESVAMSLPTHSFPSSDDALSPISAGAARVHSLLGVPCTSPPTSSSTSPQLSVTISTTMHGPPTPSSLSASALDVSVLASDMASASKRSHSVTYRFLDDMLADEVEFTAVDTAETEVPRPALVFGAPTPSSNTPTLVLRSLTRSSDATVTSTPTPAPSERCAVMSVMGSSRSPAHSAAETLTEASKETPVHETSATPANASLAVGVDATTITATATDAAAQTSAAPTTEQALVPSSSVIEIPGTHFLAASTRTLRSSSSTSTASSTSARLPPLSSLNLHSLLCEGYLSARADDVVSFVQPTHATLAHLDALFEYVRSLTRRVLQGYTYPFGSYALHTFLPDGDIDACCFTSKPNDNQWATKLVTALCTEALGDSKDAKPPPASIRSVQLVNGNIKVIKTTIGQTNVDIISNHTHTIAALVFFEDVDRLLQQQHLFKRAILLSKTWAQNECSIIGGANGLLTSYALRVMLLYVFNRYYATIETPLQALYLLLEVAVHFDWANDVFTVYGPLSRDALPASYDALATEFVEKHGFPPLLTREFMAQYNMRDSAGVLGTTPASADAVFACSYINVMDPLDPTNNIARSVSLHQAAFFKNTLKREFARWNDAIHTYALAICTQLAAQLPAPSPSIPVPSDFGFALLTTLPTPARQTLSTLSLSLACTLFKGTLEAYAAPHNFKFPGRTAANFERLCRMRDAQGVPYHYTQPPTPLAAPLSPLDSTNDTEDTSDVLTSPVSPLLQPQPARKLAGRASAASATDEDEVALSRQPSWCSIDSAASHTSQHSQYVSPSHSRHTLTRSNTSNAFPPPNAHAQQSWKRGNHGNQDSPRVLSRADSEHLSASSVAGSQSFIPMQYSGSHVSVGSHHSQPASPLLSAGALGTDYPSMVRNLQHARQFEQVRLGENDLVMRLVYILEVYGSSAVGKLGSLLHDLAQNHTLPAMVKEEYGGMKKLLQRHPDVFVILDNHPFNPQVELAPNYQVPLHRMGGPYVHITEDKPNSLPTHSSGGSYSAQGQRGSRKTPHSAVSTPVQHAMAAPLSRPASPAPSNLSARSGLDSPRHSHPTLHGLPLGHSHGPRQNTYSSSHATAAIRFPPPMLHGGQGANSQRSGSVSSSSTPSSPMLEPVKPARSYSKSQAVHGNKGGVKGGMQRVRSHTRSEREGN